MTSAKTLSNAELEQQLIELQMQVTYQEDTIQSLNEVITLQQSDILELKQQLTQFVQEVKNASSSSEGGSLFDERPPHY